MLCVCFYKSKIRKIQVTSVLFLTRILAMCALCHNAARPSFPLSRCLRFAWLSFSLCAWARTLALWPACALLLLLLVIFVPVVNSPYVCIVRVCAARLFVLAHTRLVPLSSFSSSTYRLCLTAGTYIPVWLAHYLLISCDCLRTIWTHSHVRVCVCVCDVWP